MNQSQDEEILIPITVGYIQQFVKDNYGRELTEEELQELSNLVWDEDYNLLSWIDAAVSQIIKDEKSVKDKDETVNQTGR